MRTLACAAVGLALISPLLGTRSARAAPPPSCQKITIAGWDAAGFARNHCAEDVVDVIHIPTDAGKDRPECVPGNPLATAQDVEKKISEIAGGVSAATSAKIGTAIGGPAGAVVGLIVGTVLNKALIDILVKNQHFEKSMCSVACVHLPVKAINVVVQGYSSPVKGQTGWALCDMNYAADIGRCAVPGGNWAAFTKFTSATNTKLGQVYCSTAQNWSATTDRKMGLRVMYDYPGEKGSTNRSTNNGATPPAETKPGH